MGGTSGCIPFCGKRRWVISILLFLVLIGLVGASCSKQDDSEAIRDLIEKGTRLAEEHEVGRILDLAVHNVRAMPGDLDRNGIKGILWRAFKYYGPLHVLYPWPDVKIEEDVQHAVAQFPFLIVKKEQSLPNLESLRNDPLSWVQEVGAHADFYRLRLELTKESGDWLVRQVILERFTGMGFEK